MDKKNLVKQILVDILSKQFLIFLFIGLFAAIINFLARKTFSMFFSFEISVLMAYPIGMITAFLLNRMLTFIVYDAKPIYKQFTYFVIFNFIGIAETVLVSIVLAEYVFILFVTGPLRYDLAHALGLAVPMFTSFLGHKYFSFGKYSIRNIIKRQFETITIFFQKKSTKKYDK